LLININKNRRRTMGKVKALLMEMEEDAEGMSAEEWAKKWGQEELFIWSRIQWELGRENVDEQFLAMAKPEGSA
jgi:hypothetical protein|tara:strand:- start:290 stop:511 length:222 start_codon:yes stop_codon:yes gene_type:complete